LPEESWPAVWARRAASIPGYCALFALGLAASPLWALAGVCTDLLLGDRTLPRFRACLFFLWYLACEVAGMLAAGLVWAATRAGSPRALEANAALQRRWSEALFAGARRIFGLSVVVDGAEVARQGPFLLFVRHSSTADTVLAAHVVANPNRLLLKYVLKRELLWDPCLDIVGRRLPNAFVRRAPDRRHEDVASVRQLARNLDAGTAVLIYPEGTRFSPPKREAALARLRAHGRSDLLEIASRYTQVLPPRLGGALSLMDAAPGVDVVFLDHAGFEGVASFAAFWRGALVGRTVRVRLRRVRAADIPHDRDLWLFNEWLETDRFVSGRDALQKAS
jgi:1-acyl-sn-glycerol-3-phosphate acyltransferase